MSDEARRLFKYAPALHAACKRLESNRIASQIPAEVKARIVQMLRGYDMQVGAIHAIEEVEQWLADNHFIITRNPCVSQSPEPVEQSAGI